MGLVGVSAGPFAGIRVVQGLLPVMRELGLVTIFWDINIGQVGKVFAEDGRLLDEAFVRRSDRFIRELIWMSKVLRHGREQVTIDEEAASQRGGAVSELRHDDDSPCRQGGGGGGDQRRRRRDGCRARVRRMWIAAGHARRRRRHRSSRRDVANGVPDNR